MENQNMNDNQQSKAEPINEGQPFPLDPSFDDMTDEDVDALFDRVPLDQFTAEDAAYAMEAVGIYDAQMSAQDVDAIFAEVEAAEAAPTQSSRAASILAKLDRHEERMAAGAAYRAEQVEQFNLSHAQ